MITERDRKEKLKTQKRFGAHLRKFRESRKMTQEQLSDKAMIERSNIARLEAGRSNPTVFVLLKLATAFEVDLDEFLRNFL